MKAEGLFDDIGIKMERLNADVGTFDLIARLKSD